MTINKTSDQCNDEPEITVDTPIAVSVEPPIETNFVATPVDAIADATSSLQKPPTCTVFAPATLEAGYTFPAQVDGIDFLVTIPDGGVTEGQSFQVPYPQIRQNVAPPSGSYSENNVAVLSTTAVAPHHIPMGKWRNDICDCCEVVHTGIFWQGLCCTPLLLGQVMTRSKLNALGFPSPSYQSTFCILASIWAGYLAFSLLISVLDSQSFIIVWFVFFTIITATTRFALRNRYQIPVKCCHGCGGKCDDLCCGLWCGCCATIQMARHTHPHNDFQYYCCSPTGLAQESPDIV